MFFISLWKAVITEFILSVFAFLSFLVSTKESENGVKEFVELEKIVHFLDFLNVYPNVTVYESFRTTVVCYVFIPLPFMFQFNF